MFVVAISAHISPFHFEVFPSSFKVVIVNFIQQTMLICGVLNLRSYQLHR